MLLSDIYANPGHIIHSDHQTKIIPAPKSDNTQRNKEECEALGLDTKKYFLRENEMYYLCLP